VAGDAAPVTATEPPVTYGRLVAELRPQRWAMLAAGLLTCTAAAAFVLLSAPRFRSEALLRVEGRNPAGGLLGSMASVPDLPGLALGRDEVETEIGVLGSRRMFDAAIDSLGLEVVVRTPRDLDHRALRAWSVGDSDLDGTLTLTPSGSEQWSLRGEFDHDGEGLLLPTSLRSGDTAALGPIRLVLTPGSTAQPITLALVPRYAVREQLRKRVQIRRRSPGARLIELRYEDRDRHRAAGVVSVILGTYLAYVRAEETGQSQRTIAEIRRTTDSVRTALRNADESLRDFQIAARLVAPGEQAKLSVTRVALLREELDKIELERGALTQMLTLVNERSNGGRSSEAYRQLATFPSLIGNRAIQDLLTTLVGLETQRSSLAVQRTAANVEVAALTQRIAEIERTVLQIGTQYGEGLDQQQREASQAVRELTAALGDLPDAEMGFVRRVRDRTVLGEMWAELERQLKQAEVADVLRTERVRLVDAPVVANPNDPVFPKKVVHLGLGLLVSLLAALATGLGLVLLRGPRSTAAVALLFAVGVLAPALTAAQPTLKPGDAVRVTIASAPSQSGTYPVDDRGVVTLPILGERMATTLPWPALRDSLLVAYRVQLREPLIAVIPLRRVVVLGEVSAQGVQYVEPAVGLVGAVAMAGGATANGDLSRVRIVRGDSSIILRNPEARTLPQVPIESGDQIYVERQGWFTRNQNFMISVVLSMATIVATLTLR